MSPRARRAFDSAKGKSDEFTGVDVTSFTAAERRELAAAGLNLAVDRRRRIVATYPRRLRVQDFRDRVSKGRGGSCEQLT